tara:strand:+ start:115 stop:1335 length:1221 start_codon:yes stop_codon:yes gene_type:complete
MIIKLADIVQIMKDKWTYGDKFFGYTEEFNDNHNTQYPSLLITPPTSVFPEIFSNNGWENYTFEVYFSDLYNRTNQSGQSIESRWQNLQDLGTEWMDMFLKHYQSNPDNYNPAPVYGFLEDSSLVIERDKEVANDQLIQIKMTFTWRVLSKCFRPQSTYPNQISNLVTWLRADSNVTFSIPTKRVSSVGDGSGNNNGVAQGVKENQPKRFSYGGASEKTMMKFNGTSDLLKSVNNFVTGTTVAGSSEFTVIEVSKINKVNENVFGYFELSSGSYLSMGSNPTGHYSVEVSDGTSVLSVSGGSPTLGKFHIASLRKQNKAMEFDYKDSSFNSNINDYDGAFDLTELFEQAKFTLGCTSDSDGLLPPSEINKNFLSGSIQEVIIYERKITDFELSKIQDYLNKKYRIY